MPVKKPKQVQKFLKKTLEESVRKKTKKTSKSLENKRSKHLELSSTKPTKNSRNNNARRLSEIDELILEDFDPDQLLEVFGEEIYDFYPAEKYLKKPKLIKKVMLVDENGNEVLFGHSETSDQIQHDLDQQNVQEDSYGNFANQPYQLPAPHEPNSLECAHFQDKQPEYSEFSEQQDCVLEDEISNYDGFSEDSYQGMQINLGDDWYGAVAPAGEDQIVPPGYNKIPTAQPSTESINLGQPIYLHHMAVEEPQQYVSGPEGSMIPIPQPVFRHPVPHPIPATQVILVQPANEPSIQLVQPYPKCQFFIAQPIYGNQQQLVQPGYTQLAQPSIAQLIQPSYTQLAQPTNSLVAQPNSTVIQPSNMQIAQPIYDDQVQLTQPAYGSQVQIIQPDIGNQYVETQADYTDQVEEAQFDAGENEETKKTTGLRRVEGDENNYKYTTEDNIKKASQSYNLENPLHGFKLTPFLTDPVWVLKKNKGVEDLKFLLLETAKNNTEDTDILYNYVEDMCELETLLDTDYLYKTHDYLACWLPRDDDIKTNADVEADKKKPKTRRKSI